MRATRGKILIERIGDPERMGLIWVPDTVKERPQKGLVISVGGGIDDIEEGDAVIFQPWSDSWVFRLPGYGDYLATITPKVIEAKLYLDSLGQPVFEPYRDRVLITPNELPDRSPSGALYLPNVGEDKAEEAVFELTGRVRAIGNLVTDVAVGDVVVMPPTGGATVGEWGLGDVLIRERELLGRVV